MRLTDNFTLEEMTFSQTAARLGIDNTPTPEVLVELRRTAELLERLREIVRCPIVVTSGYRSPALNDAVPGSSKTSAHMTGRAADVHVVGIRPMDLCLLVAAHHDVLMYDQCIYEFRSWTHIGRGELARCQDLTIDERGTQLGFVA